MFRRLFMIVTILFLISPAAQAKEKELKIALWKLPFNLPAMVAIEDRTYEKVFDGEYLVRYINLPSGPRQVQAIAAGELDISEGLGVGAVIVGIANGVDMTIIGANSRSPEAFAVVVKDPEIIKISDLRGKKIAGLRGSVVYQLFVELLQKEKFTEKDVEFFPMTLSASASALIAGRVDAALLAGTEILRAEKGGCRVLKNGKGYIEGLSLIVARREFAEKNPAAIEKYLKERDSILIETAMSPRKFVPLLQKETGLSEKDVIKLLTKFDYGTKITNKDIDEIRKTAESLKGENIIKIIPSMNKILWKR